MRNPSRTYLLLQERLGQDLREYVTSRRDDGDSWNAVAVDLNEQTSVVVTAETLRIWFFGLPRGQRSGAA